MSVLENKIVPYEFLQELAQCLEYEEHGLQRFVDELVWYIAESLSYKALVNLEHKLINPYHRRIVIWCLALLQRKRLIPYLQHLSDDPCWLINDIAKIALSLMTRRAPPPIIYGQPPKPPPKPTQMKLL